MSASKKGPVVESGLCRCCGSVKRCRVLNVEYEWNGVKEVYSEIFLDCFGLCLSHLEVDPTERLICATCVTRLRDASSFRHQVLQCEKRLLQTEIHIEGEPMPFNGIKTEPEIKEEVEDAAYDSVADDGPDDARDEPPADLPVAQGKESESPCKAQARDGGARAMLLKLKKMRAKLKKIQAGDAETTTESNPQPQPLRPWKSASQKAFHNTVVLVENSYVCPFVTAFSDYHCVYCKELHPDPEHLRQHVLTHDPTVYKDTVIYKTSLQIDIARIDCRLCAEPIDKLEDFYTHITSVHGKMLYPNIKNEFLKFKLKLGSLDCLECGMNFQYFHALKKHMAEHFGTWICDVCGAHFFEENKLLAHQKCHQNRSSEDKFPCKDCGRVFKSKHGRYYHMSRQHSDTPQYQCHKCEEGFFTYTLRYRHMIEAHGEHRKFPCEHCEKVYDTRKSLREHNRKNHLKVLKHECGVCEKKFYLPSALKDHMASHTGERNFRCEYCGKSYPRLRALRVHVQSHDTDKRHKCGVCSAAYTQGNNLKHHIRAKHPHVLKEAEGS